MSKSIFCSNLFHPPFGVSLLQSVVNYRTCLSSVRRDRDVLDMLTVGSIRHKKTLTNTCVITV